MSSSRTAKARCLALCLLAILLLCPTMITAETSRLPQLQINEFMASNKTGLMDALERHPDWVELYNPTDQTVSLQGLCLSDKPDELTRYRFPDDAVIAPYGYLIVFASDTPDNILTMEYHAPFKLSASGEAIVLSDGSTVIDAVLYEEQTTDISYARDESGAFVQTTTPTPGEKNIITLYISNE